MQTIHKRRSVRLYKEAAVKKEDIKKVLQAGIQAPSGKNGQPWRFAVVQEDKELLRKIADCTVYKFVSTADCLICVFMDKQESYHYVKDCQAVGACIQNMLLAATAQKLGACWIGEILNKANSVREILQTDNRYELMAVIALGYPEKNKTQKTARKTVSECTLFNR